MLLGLRNFSNFSIIPFPLVPCIKNDYFLNVNESVGSNNVTEHNVCKVSSANKLVKSSNVSKPISSNNVDKRNVRSGSSVSQLIKIFNVSKPICSSNAGNLVICNSTCKPVSKFVSEY